VSATVADLSHGKAKRAPMHFLFVRRSILTDTKQVRKDRP
jgi:hypothetical protein